MDLKLYEIFIAVAETGSLTKAAVMLGTTQPAVSRSIAGLEKYFGEPLLSRTGRGVVLTETGEVALPRVRALLNQAEELSVDLRELGRSPGGTVSLGILPSLVQPLAGKLFAQLRLNFPRVRLCIFEGYSDQIEEWIAAGRVDIGLLARYRPRHTNGQELLNSRLMLVGPPDICTSPEVDFMEMSDVPLVLPAIPNGLRMLVDEAAQRLGLELNVVMDADCLGAPKELARHHGCFTILSPEAIWEELSLGSLSASYIVNPELNRQISIATTTHHPLSRASREVLRSIHQIGHNLNNHSQQQPSGGASRCTSSLPTDQ
ncbi:LysR family transcriptional regulator [Marinobacter caseinilyticus]|uniref:LysR family transcriptional regulator n=1 Tax=Marinobacter caseinilyticus TaxID=2692195 RepID=UPI00140A995D|nr:LysR family transcriptional regulator [Marinobacter caseinilyticus]